MNDELQFPLRCHFRIITHAIEKIDFVIETVLQGLGISAPLHKENTSRGGKYLSFSVDVEVSSKEQMDRIDSELRAIEGVKMVL